MNIQEESNAINGQGSNKSGLEPRGLKRDKAKNPNETSFDVNRDQVALYARVVSPSEIEVSRVIVQLQGSEVPHVPISSQLNQEINPTMENKQVSGGDRIII